MSDENGNLEIEISIGGGFIEDMQPIVNFYSSQIPLELPPTEAYRIGMRLIEAAINIQNDHALLTILANREIPMDTALSIIQALRSKRSD